MEPNEKIDWNGVFLSDPTHLSVKHSGFYYGLSVYETCLALDSKVAFFSEHIQRLKLSSDFIQLNPSLGFWSELKDRISRLLSNEKGLHRLRIILAPKDILNSSDFDSCILANPILKVPETISLFTSSIKKPFPNPYPSFLKISSNHYSLFSYKEAKKNGFDEGLMLTVNGLVTEGSYCNLFWYKNGRIFTPALHCSILEGVTRSKIIESANKNHLQIEEGEFSLEDLKTAEQIYISSSTRGLINVKKWDHIEFDLKDSDIIKSIKETYNTIVYESLKEW